jgi:toxin-antitoxin system PIN domain toxin
MYLVDADVLVRASHRESPHHAAANNWLLEALDGPARTVGLPWPSALAFMRIMTDPRMFARPSAAVEAWETVEDWVRRPAAWIPVPGQRHMAHFERVVRSVQPTGNLLHDAHLAALASEHALTIVSADGDFARFDGVKWMNPLSGS